MRAIGKKALKSLSGAFLVTAGSAHCRRVMERTEHPR
jgi:hypothetical protein